MMQSVRLARRVAFSSGHRYWLSRLSEEENRRLFGPWASPYNHGHNYVLEATFAGPVDPATGMVVNIKDLDAILQERIVAQFDQKSINDEIPHFADRSPSLEAILEYIRSQIGALPGGVGLERLKLEETPTLWAESSRHNGGWNMTLTRVYEFAASHRLHAPSLSERENVELFGKCNNPAGHGHNYILEVTVEGEPDPRTGMIADIGSIDSVVDELVVERYDHKNLSEDVPEFRDSVATSEVIVQRIWDALQDKLPARLKRVRLYETARNIFEIEA